MPVRRETDQHIGLEVPDSQLPDPRLTLGRSLRYSMQRQPIKDDVWATDMPIYEPGEEGSYDHFFQSLLEEEGVKTFQDLFWQRKQQGLSAHVLDLFGGGLFIDDLDSVDTITGARFLDPTPAMLQRINGEIDDFDGSEGPQIRSQKTSIRDRLQTVTSSPKWSIVPGNLFKQATWHNLDDNRSSQGFLFYDTVVLKSEGANSKERVFHPEDLRNRSEQTDDIHALKFLRLLNNAYTRLSSQRGMIFAEVPEFIAGRHLNGFQERLAAGNITMSVMDTPYWPGNRNIKLVKQPTSAPNLEKLVRAAPLRRG